MAAVKDSTPKVDIALVEKWLIKSKRDGVNIVVVGETGYGKSTLINGLVGEDVMPTGFSASAVTKSVIKYEHGECIRIFDAPGFFSAKSPVVVGEIVRQIADETEGKIDLLVYCHDMQSRITEQTIREIGYIADTLCTQKNTRTPSWKNVLCVLTRANHVESSMMEELEEPGQPVDPSAVKLVETQFEELYHELCKDILEGTEAVVRRKKLPCDAAEIKGIPVVAAGFRKAALPGCEDWLSNLWEVAYSRVNQAACPAFLDATALHRLQPKGVGPDQSEQLPSQRRICNDEIAGRFSSKRRASVVYVSLAALCTAGGAAVGAAIGTIGGPVGIAAGAAVGSSNVCAVSYAGYKTFISDSEKPKKE